MKILGHPIHVMLIHFPSALFPMDLVCSFLGQFSNGPSFAFASFCAMAGGGILGCMATVTGTFDLLKVMKEKPGALSKALIHGGVNSTVVLVYLVLAWRAWNTYPVLPLDGPALLIVKSALVTFLLAGNYIGGSLVLKEGIGVEKQP